MIECAGRCEEGCCAKEGKEGKERRRGRMEGEEEDEAARRRRRKSERACKKKGLSKRVFTHKDHPSMKRIVVTIKRNDTTRPLLPTAEKGKLKKKTSDDDKKCSRSQRREREKRNNQHTKHDH